MIAGSGKGNDCCCICSWLSALAGAGACCCGAMGGVDFLGCENIWASISSKLIIFLEEVAKDAAGWAGLELDGG